MRLLKIDKVLNLYYDLMLHRLSTCKEISDFLFNNDSIVIDIFASFKNYSSSFFRYIEACNNNKKIV